MITRCYNFYRNVQKTTSESSRVCYQCLLFFFMSYKRILTECVHELVVALLPVSSSVDHRVAVGRGLAERSGGVMFTITAAAVVAPRGAGRVRRAAAAAAAHLLDHFHLCSQLCQQQQLTHFHFHLSAPANIG